MAVLNRLPIGAHGMKVLFLLVVAAAMLARAFTAGAAQPSALNGSASATANVSQPLLQFARQGPLCRRRLEDCKARCPTDRRHSGCLRGCEEAFTRCNEN